MSTPTSAIREASKGKEKCRIEHEQNDAEGDRRPVPDPDLEQAIEAE
jgi:hypothetical protein